MSATSPNPIQLRPIGHVESPLTERATAPKQGDEGAPEAVLVFEPAFIEGLRSLRVGADTLLFTWLDRADREVLSAHPRGDASRPEEGVYSTRSPDRPNPIGLHRVRLLTIDGARLRVTGLEALDGTPILDLKPVLDPARER